MKQQEGRVNWVWRIMYPIFAYMGIYYFVYLLAGILGTTMGILRLEQTGGLTYTAILGETVNWLNAYSYEIATAGSLLTLPVACLFMSWDRKTSQNTQAGHVPLFFYLVAFILGAAGCLAVNSLMSISGLTQLYAESMETIAGQLYKGRLIVELIGIGLISPLVEEMLFRGLAMNRMKELIPSHFAIVLSALLFALYHGNMLQAIYAFILGLIFGYVYDRYHHLAAPVLVHCGANIVSVLGSETNMFDAFFASEQSQMLYAVIWCLVILACIYLIHYRIRPVSSRRE